MEKNLDGKDDKIRKSIEEWNGRDKIMKELWIWRKRYDRIRNELSNVLKAKPKNWKEATNEEKQKLKILEGLSLKEVKEFMLHNTLNAKKELNSVIWEPWHLRFGLVSDTHFWSKVAAIDELWEFYDRAKDKWVECFIHAGDLVDGHNVYKWHIFELDKLWAEEQAKLVINKYPNVGLDTYYILWNHCESFLKEWNIDIGKMISNMRKDLIYLGFYSADITVNWIKVWLQHWAWWNAYARSYKIQKMAENINPKDQPHIYAAWHRHTALYQFYRKMHLFLPWAFQKSTLLSKRLWLDNTVWWWVIDINIDKYWWTQIRMEFIKI